MQQIFHHKKRFYLESGQSLPELHISYHTYGKLNTHKNNVIWVTHALTANADVFEWWKGLFGEDALFNPNDYFIVCANVIGSHYGSTGPLSENPETGLPYYHHFPAISIRDMVNAHELLRQELHIEKIHLLIGGSLGGQQALEWSILNPSIIQNLVLIATNARHSAWGIAFNESQRLAIAADRTWHNQSPDAGMKGLKAARSIALLSYRNYHIYTQTQTDVEDSSTQRAVTYQHYQGEKLCARFNAYSYWILSRAMDSHHVGRNRESIENALRQIQAKTLVIGIQSDILFPVSEQEELQRGIQGSKLKLIESRYGHDGFLIETKKLTEVINNFFAHQPNKKYSYA